MTRGGAVILQLPEASTPGDPGPDLWLGWNATQIGGLTQCPPSNVQEDWPLIAQELANNGILDRETAAGAIGTIAMETAHTFKPVREAFWLSEEWRRLNLWYWPYYGRGHLQITHRYNYEALGVAVGVDLVNDPDRALETWISAVGLANFFASHNIHVVARAHNWTEVRRRVLGASPSDQVAYLTRIAETLISS